MDADEKLKANCANFHELQQSKFVLIGAIRVNDISVSLHLYPSVVEPLGIMTAP
jgi:hypothetical protein